MITRTEKKGTGQALKLEGRRGMTRSACPLYDLQPRVLAAVRLDLTLSFVDTAGTHAVGKSPHRKTGLVALGRGIRLESAPGRWVLDVPRLSVLDFNIAETIHALILQNFDPRLGLMRGFGLLHRGGAWGQDGLRRHGQGQER